MDTGAKVDVGRSGEGGGEEEHMLMVFLGHSWIDIRSDAATFAWVGAGDMLRAICVVDNMFLVATANTAGDTLWRSD